MKNKAKDILLKILEIIDYQKNKSEFANKFLDMIYKQAFLKVIENLPDNKKLNLDNEIKNKNLDKSMEILLNYVSKEDFEETVERVALEMFIDYIQKIMPTLTDEKKSKLRDFLSELQS